MTAAATFLVLSLAGMTYAYAADSGPMLILGFWAFLISLGCVDYFSDRFNNRASDSLHVLGRDRVGYDEDQVA